MYARFTMLYFKYLNTGQHRLEINMTRKKKLRFIR